MASTALNIGNYSYTGLEVASQTAPAAFAAGGSLAGLGAAIPFIGAGLALAPVAINLFKCGTVSSVGCDKRSDTTVTMSGEAAGRKAVYLVETGQIPLTQGRQALPQIGQEIQAHLTNVQRSWNGPYQDNSCGQWLAGQQNATNQVKITGSQVVPTGTIASSVHCGVGGDSLATVFNSVLPTAMAQAAAKAQAQGLGIYGRTPTPPPPNTVGHITSPSGVAASAPTALPGGVGTITTPATVPAASTVATTTNWEPLLLIGLGVLLLFS